MVRWVLLFLVLSCGLAKAQNRTRTPGAVRPLSTASVCATKWGVDARHVTAKMKRDVAAAYGIPQKDWGLYVFDHLIPRELAGADDVKNLWPQRKAEARRKDVRENALHVSVCAGRMTLRAAQREMRQWGQK